MIFQHVMKTLLINNIITHPHYFRLGWSPKVNLWELLWYRSTLQILFKSKKSDFFYLNKIF